MLTPVESESAVVRRDTAHAAESQTSRRRGEEFLTLTAGDFLFSEGDARTHVYRVDSGVLCLYRTLPDGSQDVVEFAFPGDLVGLGYLDSHAATAQATMLTTLACLPRSALDDLAEKSARTRSRLTAAIEREVAYLKDAIVRREKPAPLQRLAALFVTLSRHNGYEGRDPAVITDSLKCGVAAGHLGMSLDALAEALTELQARGLIEPHEKGLRLLDLEVLDRLSDGLD